MAEEERLSIELIKPRFDVGQRVYVACRNGPSVAEIKGYLTEVQKHPNGFYIGFVKEYETDPYVFGPFENDGFYSVTGENFYEELDDARKASRFLPVNASEESWGSAIGVREEIGEYSIDDADLGPCCGQIASARDILYLCQNEGGLIVHYRDRLSGLLNGHGLHVEEGRPLKNILGQLVEELNQEL